jgi:hypothetical protein
MASPAGRVRARPPSLAHSVTQCLLTRLPHACRAYNEPWPHRLRYVGDAKPFWFNIVSYATQCDSREAFDQIYDYYQRPEAWIVAPGAVDALQRLRDRGIK